MMLLSSLFPNPSLHKSKLILYRCKKSNRAQASASPTEQARGVHCGNFSDLFAGCHMNFCNFISNIRHKSRFVALAALRDGGKERRIGLDEKPLKRQLSDDLTFLFRVFVRNGSRDAEVEIERNRLSRRFEISVIGMQDAGFFRERMIVGA